MYVINNYQIIKKSIFEWIRIPLMATEYMFLLFIFISFSILMINIFFSFSHNDFLALLPQYFPINLSIK